jgi:hypothetical protein
MFEMGWGCLGYRLLGNVDGLCHFLCLLGTRKRDWSVCIVHGTVGECVLVRSRKPKLTAVGIRCADHATPSIG